jgi:hypothetical protein
MLIHVVTANQAEMAKAFSHTIAHGFSLSGSSLLTLCKSTSTLFFFLGAASYSISFGKEEGKI